MYRYIFFKCLKICSDIEDVEDYQYLHLVHQHLPPPGPTTRRRMGVWGMSSSSSMTTSYTGTQAITRTGFRLTSALHFPAAAPPPPMFILPHMLDTWNLVHSTYGAFQYRKVFHLRLSWKIRLTFKTSYLSPHLLASCLIFKFCLIFKLVLFSKIYGILYRVENRYLNRTPSTVACTAL